MISKYFLWQGKFYDTIVRILHYGVSNLGYGVMICKDNSKIWQFIVPI